MDIKSLDFDTVYRGVVKHRHENTPQRLSKVDSIKPSGATECMREDFFKTFMPTNIKFETQVIFDHGNLIHDDHVAGILQYWITNVLKNPKAVIVNEERLLYDLGGGDYLSAYVDNLFKVLEDGEMKYVPIEIKSINSRGFSKLRTPVHKNMVQTILYMYAYKSKYGVIVYVDKALLKTKTYIIYRDLDEFMKLPKSEMFRSIHIDVLKLALLYIAKRKCANNYKRKGVLPPAEYRISQNSELYLKLVNDGVIMGSKEEYEKEHKGYKCTDDYPSGDPVCSFRDECIASGLEPMGEEE